MKIQAFNNIYNIYQNNQRKISTQKPKYQKNLKCDCFEYQNLSFGKKMAPMDFFNAIGRQNFPNETILALAEKNALNGRDLDLYNIHMAYYAPLAECDTLEEAKALYPEFCDVIDASDLEDSELSRKMKAIKRGEIENLNIEDLSLELLKKQYSQALGVNKREEYWGCANDAICLMFKILNIKRLPANYFRQLTKLKPDVIVRHDKNIKQYYIDNPEDRDKISKRQKKFFIDNPQYREKISKSNTERFKDPEERKKISEGLKRYYLENPERIPIQAEKIRKFYEEHPEYLEIFSQAGKEVKSEVMSAVAEEFPNLKGILKRKDNGEPLTEEQKTYLATYFKRCLEIYPEMNLDAGRRIQEMLAEHGIVPRCKKKPH